MIQRAGFCDDLYLFPLAAALSLSGSGAAAAAPLARGVFREYFKRTSKFFLSGNWSEELCSGGFWVTVTK
jgi:hypothetical protein